MTVIPCRFFAASLRPAPVGAPPSGPAEFKDRMIEKAQLLVDQWQPHALTAAPYVVAFFIGIGAAAIWQSAGPAAGPAAAMSADQQQLNAILLDTTRRSVERIAANIAVIEDELTRRVDRLGAGQDQLASSQDQITREITRLQAVLSKTPETKMPETKTQETRVAETRTLELPRPASALPPAQRPSQRSAETNGSNWRRQPCCQWPGSDIR